MKVLSLSSSILTRFASGNHLIVLLVFCSLFATAQPISHDPAVKSAREFEKIRRVPVPQRPFLYVNTEEIVAARRRAENEEWAKSVKESYIRIADEWLKKDYSFVKKIIPVEGSIYTYGLGLDLDPLEQKKMKWRGWEDPRHVEAANGAIYPNEKYPDSGLGWIDPQGKTTYYFTALANGMTIKKLEGTELPALVNAYLLTADEAYAERALWILDAIATIYPRSYEGPIDYPHNEPGRPDGGRLDRPYYQAARALMNYAYFAEMLSMSKHANKPSPSNSQYSMLKNIELNMLMNGADYCLRMVKAGKGASLELNNGNIDYNRAPLVVGALLGIPEWVDWALNGPLGFKNALSNTIDINGRYFETGTSYASHTRELLLSTAHFLRRMRLPEYPEGYAAYDDSRFALFALDFFTGIQVAGRLPLFGDAGPDSAIIPHTRIFDSGTLKAAHDFYRYSDRPDVRNDALKAAAEMINSMPANYKHSGADLFEMYGWEKFVKKAEEQGVTLTSQSRSTLFFDYGTLVLRSGGKKHERAALVRFGPTLNHGQADELGLAFYAKGREFSFDPGYFNTHLRFGFTTSTVAHNVLVVNRQNQLRKESPGADLQTWTDGDALRSAALNNPHAYADQNVKEYKRRVTLIDLSDEDSYIIDNFWASGARDYDYSLHGIKEGKLTVLPSSKAVLLTQRKGSVMGPDVDYSSELDPNGRVNSYADKPFYFAPPGEGFGFLSHPGFYSLNGPAHLLWSATDTTGHKMYVSHFAPPSAQLITSQSPKLRTLDVAYALSRVSVPVSETVRFTSVILPTEGENKIANIKQLLPLDGSSETFALHLTPQSDVKSDVREHYYMASNKTVNASFENGLTFTGEEGFLGLNAEGKVVSASLTGTGSINKGTFEFTVEPLFSGPLEVIKVESQPLRVLVNARYEQTSKLAGSIVRLNKHTLARPFALRVDSSIAAGNQSWLIMDASSNIHALGIIKNYDSKTRVITTDSPFPHGRPYTFSYNVKTGMAGSGVEKKDYNGGYNGFWLVNEKTKKKAAIKDLRNKLTQIVLDENASVDFRPGDKFEITLLAPGDLLQVPAWSQVKRNENGQWQINGPANVFVKE